MNKVWLLSFSRKVLLQFIIVGLMCMSIEAQSVTNEDKELHISEYEVYYGDDLHQERFLDIDKKKDRIKELYGSYPNKGPIVNGIRRTIFTDKSEYQINEKVIVFHVAELMESDWYIYSNTAFANVNREYVNGELESDEWNRGEQNLFNERYSIKQAPFVDVSFKETVYQFKVSGEYRIQWREPIKIMKGPFDSNNKPAESQEIYLESNLLTLKVLNDK